MVTGFPFGTMELGFAQMVGFGRLSGREAEAGALDESYSPLFPPSCWPQALSCFFLQDVLRTLGLNSKEELWDSEGRTYVSGSRSSGSDTTLEDSNNEKCCPPALTPSPFHAGLTKAEQGRGYGRHSTNSARPMLRWGGD
jgi:hypothetical protein